MMASWWTATSAAVRAAGKVHVGRPIGRGRIRQAMFWFASIRRPGRVRFLCNRVLTAKWSND
jgi:hypothetical protein